MQVKTLAKHVKIGANHKNGHGHALKQKLKILRAFWVLKSGLTKFEVDLVKAGGGTTHTKSPKMSTKLKTADFLFG